MKHNIGLAQIIISHEEEEEEKKALPSQE